MSLNQNTYKYITDATTTTFAGETTRTVIATININKTLIGTLTIKAGTTTIGIFAAGTLPGEYWYSANGTEIESLSVINSAAADVTVFYRNI